MNMNKRQKLAEIASQLATVRDWCEIPEETEAGINGVLDALNELIDVQYEDEKNTNMKIDKNIIMPVIEASSGLYVVVNARIKVLASEGEAAIYSSRACSVVFTCLKTVSEILEIEHGLIHTPHGIEYKGGGIILVRSKEDAGQLPFSDMKHTITLEIEVESLSDVSKLSNIKLV
jgi:hypothetical protein